MNQSAFGSSARHAQARNGKEKVAILLLSLGNDLGAKLLQKFDSTELKTIMTSASSLGQVDKDDLDFLVDDFAARFAKAIGLGTDFESMRSLVERAFPPTTLAEMLSDGPQASEEPIWQRLTPGFEASLVPYLLQEHPQTAAFTLSKLDPDLAARCMSLLPNSHRGTIVRRMLQLQSSNPDVESIVDRCIQQDLLSKSGKGSEAEGRSRLAALLNKLDRDQSNTILEAVAEWQPEEAAQLKQMIFSFEDLDKLSQPARLALFDKLQTEQVIAALRGMPSNLKEVALSSLGARARRMVEAELATDNGQKTKDGDVARRDIADLVLDLVKRGEIKMPDSNDPVSS